MHRLLAFGALLLACGPAAHANTFLYSGAILSGMTVVADKELPSIIAQLPGLASPAKRVRSEDLPARLAGYDGFVSLYAWGWQPRKMTAAQIEALSAWLAFGGVLLVPEGAFDGPQPSWLEGLLPSEEERKQGGCRLRGLGAACPILSYQDGLAPAEHWLARRSRRPSEPAWYGAFSNASHAIQRVLESRNRRRNPAAPLLAFSIAYAVCVAWLSWRWFRERGLEDRAWLGVLALTGLFTLGAALGSRWLAGGSREVQVAVLHGVPEAKLLRMTGWLARFSADRERWRTELPNGVSTVWDLQGSSDRRPRPTGPLLEGRSEPGQTTSFAFAGERRLEAPMRLELIQGDGGPQVSWSNETGLAFDRLWLVGSNPESGAAAPTGSRGRLPLGAAEGRGFLPPPGWNSEESALVETFLQGEVARCPDCAHIAAVRSEAGDAGRKLLYLWSVPRVRDVRPIALPRAEMGCFAE